MAYTSKHVTDAAIRAVSVAVNMTDTLIELSILFALKGGTPAAFAGAVAHIGNPHNGGKPYSVKLPFNIGRKLAGHINDGREHGVETLNLEEARKAAADYRARFAANAAGMGANSYAQMDKIAAEPIGSNAVAETLAKYDADLAAKAATRAASAVETKALIEAGKVAKAGPEVARPVATDVTEVDVQAIFAAALELINSSDPTTLDVLGEAITLRRQRLATVEAERAKARAKVRKAA